MKKIVFLKSGSKKKGGLERYTERLMGGFLERGHEVILLTSGPFDKGPFETISLCQRSPFSLIHLLSFDKSCQKWLSQNRPDIIFGLDRNSVQTHYRAGSGVHAAYLQRRKTEEGFLKSLTFTLNPLHQTILSLEKKTYEGERTKRIFTNSEMVKKEILSHYNTPASKISVVHNGVDLEAYQIGPILSNTLHQFLFVGHGWQRKGLTHLLKALHLIKKEPFHLTVVGKDKQKSYYKSLVDRLDLSSKVTFVGSQPSVLPFFQKADTLVIPSAYDPFANVTLEALAMGLFVISSAYNGASELLTKESGTILKDLKDLSTFSQSLKEALNRPKTKESAEKIRSTIDLYSIRNQIDKIVEETLQDAS